MTREQSWVAGHGSKSVTHCHLWLDGHRHKGQRSGVKRTNLLRGRYTFLVCCQWLLRQGLSDGQISNRTFNSNLPRNGFKSFSQISTIPIFLQISKEAICAFLFASVSKQLICRDSTLFQIESQKFQIKAQIESQSFEANLYSSSRISKRAQITIWIPIAIGICPSLLGLRGTCHHHCHHHTNHLDQPAGNNTPPTPILRQQ